MTASADHGPASQYEVVWKSGHIDRFSAHQVSHTGGHYDLFQPLGAERRPERVQFHGEFDGHWQLVLSAPMDEISTIRNLTVCNDEPKIVWPDGEPS